jgi:hypothetical protein
MFYFIKHVLRAELIDSLIDRLQNEMQNYENKSLMYCVVPFCTLRKGVKSHKFHIRSNCKVKLAIKMLPAIFRKIYLIKHFD